MEDFIKTFDSLSDEKKLILIEVARLLIIETSQSVEVARASREEVSPT